MEAKRNKLLSCLEERWRDSADDLRCFSVLATNMKNGRMASWVGGHYSWTLDDGGIALLAQAMSIPRRRVSQKQVKYFLQNGVKNFDWLKESDQVHTFHPMHVVKPYAVAFFKGYTGLNASVMTHIADCLEICTGSCTSSPLLWVAQDCCHWLSADEFDLSFKIGQNFDRHVPLLLNPQVNRVSTLQLLDQLSRTAGSRIVSRGEMSRAPPAAIFQSKKKLVFFSSFSSTGQSLATIILDQSSVNSQEEFDRLNNLQLSFITQCKNLKLLFDLMHDKAGGEDKRFRETTVMIKLLQRLKHFLP
uniref:Uncharacterized protein n=1 Tax=Ditylenchus dipsaci TaxID=166011 RepID=A0A915EPY6_9BILA